MPTLDKLISLGFLACLAAGYPKDTTFLTDKLGNVTGVSLSQQGGHLTAGHLDQIKRAMAKATRDMDTEDLMLMMEKKLPSSSEQQIAIHLVEYNYIANPNGGEGRHDYHVLDPVFMFERHDNDWRFLGRI